MREQMNEKIPDKHFERQLWHGTSVTSSAVGLMPLISICAKGFNRSYSGSSTGKHKVHTSLLKYLV